MVGTTDINNERKKLFQEIQEKNRNGDLIIILSESPNEIPFDDKVEITNAPTLKGKIPSVKNFLRIARLKEGDDLSDVNYISLSTLNEGQYPNLKIEEMETIEEMLDDIEDLNRKEIEEEGFELEIDSSRPFKRGLYGLLALTALGVSFVFYGNALSYGLLPVLANNVIGQAAIFVSNLVFGALFTTPVGTVALGATIGAFAGLAIALIAASLLLRAAWYSDSKAAPLFRFFGPLNQLDKPLANLVYSLSALIPGKLHGYVGNYIIENSYYITGYDFAMTHNNYFISRDIGALATSTKTVQKAFNAHVGLDSAYRYNPMLILRGSLTVVRNLLFLSVDSVGYLIHKRLPLTSKSSYPTRLLKALINIPFSLVELPLIALQLIVDLPITAGIMVRDSIVDLYQMVRSRKQFGYQPVRDSSSPQKQNKEVPEVPEVPKSTNHSENMGMYSMPVNFDRGEYELPGNANLICVNPSARFSPADPLGVASTDTYIDALSIDVEAANNTGFVVDTSRLDKNGVVTLKEHANLKFNQLLSLKNKPLVKKDETQHYNLGSFVKFVNKKEHLENLEKNQNNLFEL